MNSDQRHDLGWMLDEALRVPEAKHAILLSSDGLLIAHSADITRDEAERHAAAMSGLQSLARANAAFCGSTEKAWQQTITEYDHGYIFLVAAGPRAYVAASAGAGVDVETMTHRLVVLVQRLGTELSADLRVGELA
ncbi:roadblock/LC7 domain-containing protein [Saccharopolyspora rhizosphaerae]|uniref:Roadblock/LC7 domain-containing protein n=1 Tax=Saccharopolyspora rhizosphaerae TaxID=2492662 RepID=A0A3R8VAT8_9PSEU|nr:roadblock/LC7 domain-containing protein [Saccharopolyspora rhizosphaerae]RRO13725.1 roadblock/LC7 domain-containing protein [Saccharopolyspora rhizosphaerae]